MIARAIVRRGDMGPPGEWESRPASSAAPAESDQGAGGSDEIIGALETSVPFRVQRVDGP